jgi:hypothetical protein
MERYQNLGYMFYPVALNVYYEKYKKIMYAIYTIKIGIFMDLHIIHELKHGFRV